MPIVDPVKVTGYYTLRRDLMHLADETNKIRLQLIEVQKLYSETVTKLVEASERLFTKSLAEMTADGQLRAEFKPDTDVQSVADHIRPSRRNCSQCGKPGHRAPSCPDAHKIQQEKKAKASKRDVIAERKAALRGTGKRACSICALPGHRAKNCPAREGA